MSNSAIAIVILYILGCVLTFLIGRSVGTHNALKKKCIGKISIITEDGKLIDGSISIDKMPKSGYVAVELIHTEVQIVPELDDKNQQNLQRP